MAPAERAAARLSHQISESNALNRAIKINLISEDEDGVDTGGQEQAGSATFFQKRTKLSSDSVKKFNSIRLKRISSVDPPPFPLEFQLSALSVQGFQIPDFRNRLFNDSTNCTLINLPESKSKPFLSVPLAKLIKETCSEIDLKGLKSLNTRINLPSQTESNSFYSILSEVEINLSTGQPILWGLTGPNGVGKTKFIELLTEKLDLRLIAIDSTQIPRNAKTFETLQTALSHSAPKSVSQFFSNEKKSTANKSKVALLFDEVEIAFESDRGYWTALSSFLQSSASKTVPIFITSNTEISFLESIIKFPDHVRFMSIKGGDHRKLAINNDFIGRLHRIDSSLAYEHFVMHTGYFYTESDKDEDISNAGLGLINEALRWDELVDNVIYNTCDNVSNIKLTDSIAIDPFSYAEYASFSDLLLSIRDNPVKMNLDIYDNLNCEFFDEVGDSFAGTLLYSIIPEVYENDFVPDLIDVAKECIGRTIKVFTDELSEDICNYPILGTSDIYWKELSKKLSRRFFDYTKSLQFHQTWSQEITSHVVFLELDNYESSTSRRRKRAFYRYLGEDLMNEILNIKPV